MSATFLTQKGSLSSDSSLSSEDRELQQTAGINYYMREIVHVIALFDQK
jgi:hypothetical protein